MLRTTTAWILALSAVLVIAVPAFSQATSPSVPDRAAAAPAEGANSILTSISMPDRYRGSVVREILFCGVSEDEKVVRGLRELVAQETGQPLDQLKIRDSILALYATGRFSTIQVEGERNAASELNLVFIAKPNYFIGPVSVDGLPKRLTENQLVTASKLQLGELFTQDKLKRAVENIGAMLSENGYYQAKVAHEEHETPDTQSVGIAFHLTCGEQARVGKIDVEGDSGLTPDSFSRDSDFHSGDVASGDRVTRGLQKLRKSFQKQKRLEAQVAVTGRKYHAGSNTLDYTFNITRGPVVDIRVEGVKLSAGQLKKYIPVFEENAVDDDLLNEGRRNLRDYLQRRGYFDVQVAYSKEKDKSGDRLDVIYKIERGDARKLVGIKIEGNKYFAEDLIRERMSVHPASGFMAHGVFSQSMLANDVQAIENLYKSNGFREVKVSSKVENQADGVKDDIAVVISIEEGQQTRVGKLRIVGANGISEESIRDRVQSLENQPFSESRLAEDRDAIISYYYSTGYSDAQLDASVAPVADDPHRMDVALKINEGSRTYVDRVLISGLHYTRPFVVNRQMKIGAGDPMSQIGILDSQRSLYDLGLFNEVDAAVQNPDGGAKYKDILLDIREAKRWTFNYGLGVEIQTGSQSLNSNQINTAPAPGIDVPPNTTPPQGNVTTANPQAGTGISPRISFDVTRLNFRGRDHTLLFKTNLSNLSRRALVSYDAPHWFDKEGMGLTFSALAENTRDVRTFAAQRYEGSVQATQVRSKITTLLYRFQYRLVKVDSSSLVISPELIPLYSKPVRVGMPSFSYIRDKRDDPIETRKGNYTTFDAGVASSIFGSAANFTRFTVQNSNYVPFKKRFVFARMTRIGVQEPYGSGDASIVPLPERYYGGGTQAHRGFALNQAGPRDLFTGFPIGGNAVLLNQLELRLPPFTIPFVGDNLNFVLFHDSGNVFSDGQDMVKSLGRWYQPRREACMKESTRLLCGFNYMSQAFGMGARYKTPVGPVRLDFSYNPNPPSFPYYVQCPSVPPSGSNAGPCAALPGNALVFQSGTLRHFNFFFSIGQTF